MLPNNIISLGQVFTPDWVVKLMLGLKKRTGRTLEPSAGDGAFAKYLDNADALEIDPRHYQALQNINTVRKQQNSRPPLTIINTDFFGYPTTQQFDTIIGNPPFVRFQDIDAHTKTLIPDTTKALFDQRTNLYIFFIEKCLHHLAPKGELIFITPRDFLKATHACALNEILMKTGTITDWIELGDTRLFQGHSPICAIWRFEKDNHSHQTSVRQGSRHNDKSIYQLPPTSKTMLYHQGQIVFGADDYTVPLSTRFSVKVGAVSGLDKIFAHEKFGNADFVVSTTRATGQTRKMILNTPHPYLLAHKEALLSRKIRTFQGNNYWQWGRLHHHSAAPRIYVNAKTRTPSPFFLHGSPYYDGSILALFPKNPNLSQSQLIALCQALNAVNWEELGFVCDGRYLFTQRSLENALLPKSFPDG